MQKKKQYPCYPFKFCWLVAAYNLWLRTLLANTKLFEVLLDLSTYFVKFGPIKQHFVTIILFRFVSMSGSVPYGDCQFTFSPSFIHLPYLIGTDRANWQYVNN